MALNGTDTDKDYKGSGNAFSEEERIDIRLWRFTEAGPGIEVCFTCRHTGVSKPPYDSLNLGFFVGDVTGDVHKNRQLLGRAIGHKASCITSPRQRHSSEVAILESELNIGAGSRMHVPNPFDPCDAMITSLQCAPLLLQFADCVPVVLAGEAQGSPIVAIAHAGRKSLVGGIVANTVAAMAGRGASPNELRVALGPAVCRSCYEVDAETASEFRARFGDAALEGFHIDLKYGVVNDLQAAGVEAADIHDLDICTCCDEDFFSYRRDGPETGRQGAVAWIE